jgi:hypothetical protein
MIRTLLAERVLVAKSHHLRDSCSNTMRRKSGDRMHEITLVVVGGAHRKLGLDLRSRHVT